SLRACTRYGDIRKAVALRVCGHADVSVRNDPDNPRCVVQDRDGSTVAFPHDLGRPVDRIAFLTAPNVTCHDLFDSHDFLRSSFKSLEPNPDLIVHGAYS